MARALALVPALASSKAPHWRGTTTTLRRVWKRTKKPLFERSHTFGESIFRTRMLNSHENNCCARISEHASVVFWHDFDMIFALGTAKSLQHYKYGCVRLKSLKRNRKQYAHFSSRSNSWMWYYCFMHVLSRCCETYSPCIEKCSMLMSVWCYGEHK